jgi:hypothetical protein
MSTIIFWNSQMGHLDRLELEFEIVTLMHNIHEFKKLGFRTAEMQSRLEYCSAEFQALNLCANSESDMKLIANSRR